MSFAAHDDPLRLSLNSKTPMIIERIIMVTERQLETIVIVLLPPSLPGKPEQTAVALGIELVVGCVATVVDAAGVSVVEVVVRVVGLVVVTLVVVVVVVVGVVVVEFVVVVGDDVAVD